MNYEDFNTLLFMAYKQNLTDEGRNQQQARELEDQMEDMIDEYGPMDTGLAIQNAIRNKELNKR